MRLVLRSVAVLLAAYVLLMGGFLVWLTWSGLRSEKLIVEETLTLLARDKAALLDEWIRDARDRTDLVAGDRLHRRLMEVLERSDIVTSITVVDADGRVMASDRTRAGTLLPSALATFKGPGKPEPFAQRIPGLMNRDHHVLFLPTWDGMRLAGYVRTTIRSTQITDFTQALRERLGREIVLGLALVALAAIVFHLQLVAHARRVSRYIDARAREGSAVPPSGDDEFSSVYRAADRMGEALDAARRQEESSASRFGQVSDVLRVGLLWFRPDKELDFVNRRACAMIGASDEQEFRMRWNENAGAGVDRMAELHDSSATRSEPIDMNLGDPPRSLRVQFYRIGTVDCEGFIGLMTDPEVIESIEDDLFLASQMKSLGRVCRTITHELRSPLGAMIMNMDLLRESLAEARAPDPAVRSAQERYVGVVQNELERLNQTLLEMLDQVAPMSQKPERVDLHPLLRDLGTLLAEQARRQRVELRLELSDPSTVLGRRDHLKQAILNVAINALEAMPRGGQLTIELTRQNGVAQVRCCDTGPGIPAEAREKVFEMGFSTKDSGTGTGLYLARMIVDQHGGTIGATDAPSGGACIQIELPSTGNGVEDFRAARAAGYAEG